MLPCSPPLLRRLPTAEGVGQGDRPQEGPEGWVVASRHHPHRSRIEAFVGRRFAEAYGARLVHFHPCLVALWAPGSASPAAAAGFGPAAVGELFLERYLDVPVEQAFAARARREVARGTIVEVGNLAASRPGDTRQMVRALVVLLRREFEWVVFTATRQVRNAIARCGLLGYDLGRASADALGIEARLWGSYYDNDPRVIGGSLPVAAAALGLEGPHAPPAALRRVEA